METRRKRQAKNQTRYRKQDDSVVVPAFAALRRMQKMERALEYILQHLQDKDCDIRSVSKAAGYETSYFQRLFPKYFDMSFDAYVTMLRIRQAARDIQRENYPKNIGSRYGFANAQSFSKAFKRVIGISPRSFYYGQYLVPDMPFRSHVEGLDITLEYGVVHAMRIKGIPLRPPNGNDTLMMENASFAFERGVLKDSIREDTDRIGIWWHDLNEELHYLFGKVEEQYDVVVSREKNNREIQDGQVTLIIQGGRYAVFSYPRPKDSTKITLMSRILCRYVFKEWIPVNGKITDIMGFTYEKFTKDRVYLYLPMTTGMEGTNVLTRSRWQVAEWADYIDSHITENLTLESLARLAGYSPKNYLEVFNMYYNITPIRYLLRRRIYLASDEVRKNPKERTSIMQKYRFSSWEKYVELHEREFACKPFAGSLKKVKLPNLEKDYKHEKDRVLLSFRSIDSKEALLHMIKESPDEEVPPDIPSLVTYWFREEFDDFTPVLNLSQGTANERKIYIWSNDPDFQDGFFVYHYYLGVLLGKNVKEQALEQAVHEYDAKKDTIPGGKYAVFRTEDKTDGKDPETAFRLLARCAFGGWISENRFRVDYQRRTFVIWEREKLFFYVPVIN